MRQPHRPPTYAALFLFPANASSHRRGRAATTVPRLGRDPRASRNGHGLRAYERCSGRGPAVGAIGTVRQSLLPAVPLGILSLPAALGRRWSQALPSDPDRRLTDSPRPRHTSRRQATPCQPRPVPGRTPTRSHEPWCADMDYAYVAGYSGAGQSVNNARRDAAVVLSRFSNSRSIGDWAVAGTRIALSRQPGSDVVPLTTKEENYTT